MYHTSINDKVRAIIEKSDDHGDSLSIMLQCLVTYQILMRHAPVLAAYQIRTRHA